MAGQISTFQGSHNLMISVGGVLFAEISNFSSSDDMSNVPVTGIGTNNALTIEPTRYSGRLSFSVTTYSQKVVDAIKECGEGQGLYLLPTHLQAVSGDLFGDGNTMMRTNFFSPAHFLLSQTVDIHLHAKVVLDDGTSVKAGPILQTYQDVTFVSNSFSISQGQLMPESYSAVFVKYIDNQNQASLG